MITEKEKTEREAEKRNIENLHKKLSGLLNEEGDKIKETLINNPQIQVYTFVFPEISGLSKEARFKQIKRAFNRLGYATYINSKNIHVVLQDCPKNKLFLKIKKSDLLITFFGAVVLGAVTIVQFPSIAVTVGCIIGLLIFISLVFKKHYDTFMTQYGDQKRF